MKKSKRILSILLAVVMILTALPLASITAFATTEASQPADGTTTSQPFIANTPSEHYRIPGLVTLNDGTLVASADARWSGYYDGGGNDTMVSRSYDNGDTWNYTFANYWGDNGNTFNKASTAFCDSEIATDGQTVYMLSTVFPAGYAINGSSANSTGLTTTDAFTTEYDGTKRLRLSLSSNTSYIYCVGAFDSTGYAKIYTVSTKTAVDGYTVDENWDLYKNGTRQGSLFYSDSDYKVMNTTFLFFRSSTDGGASWSAPTLVPMQKGGSEYFLGVGPGRGVVVDNPSGTGKRIVFGVYKYAGSSSSQRASFIYSDDGGETWTRTDDATGSWSSENAVVDLGNNVIRMFYRNGNNVVSYVDFTWNSSTSTYTVGSTVSTGLACRGDCQLSAIMYPYKINGKRCILVSCPRNTGSRTLGVVYSLFLNDDTNAVDSTQAYSISGSSDRFEYSCMTVLQDGRLGILYEGVIDTEGDLVYKTFDVATLTGGTISMPTVHNIAIKEGATQDVAVTSSTLTNSNPDTVTAKISNSTMTLEGLKKGVVKITVGDDLYIVTVTEGFASNLLVSNTTQAGNVYAQSASQRTKTYGGKTAYTICNDGANDNFSFAYFKLSLEDIIADDADQIVFNTEMVSDDDGTTPVALGDYQGLTYSLVDPTKTVDFSTVVGSNGGDSAISALQTYFSTDASIYIKDFFNVDKDITQTVDQTPSSGSYYALSGDVTNAIKLAIDKGLTEVGIVVYQSGSGSSGAPWSDSWISGDVSLTYSNQYDYAPTGTPTTSINSITYVGSTTNIHDQGSTILSSWPDSSTYASGGSTVGGKAQDVAGDTCPTPQITFNGNGRYTINSVTPVNDSLTAISTVTVNSFSKTSTGKQTIGFSGTYDIGNTHLSDNKYYQNNKSLGFKISYHDTVTDTDNDMYLWTFCRYPRHYASGISYLSYSYQAYFIQKSEGYGGTNSGLSLTSGYSTYLKYPTASTNTVALADIYGQSNFDTSSAFIGTSSDIYKSVNSSLFFDKSVDTISFVVDGIRYNGSSDVPNITAMGINTGQTLWDWSTMYNNSSTVGYSQLNQTSKTTWTNSTSNWEYYNHFYAGRTNDGWGYIATNYGKQSFWYGANYATQQGSTTGSAVSSPGGYASLITAESVERNTFTAVNQDSTYTQSFNVVLALGQGNNHSSTINFFTNIYVTDKGDLRTLVNDTASSFPDKNLYTPDSYSTFLTAYKNACNVLNSNVTENQSDVTTATTNLQTAIDNLVECGTIKQYNQIEQKTQLLETKFNSEEYTTSSVAQAQQQLDDVTAYTQATGSTVAKTTVQVEVDKFADINSTLEKRANMAELREANEEATTLLDSLVDNDTPMYTESQIRALAEQSSTADEILANSADTGISKQAMVDEATENIEIPEENETAQIYDTAVNQSVLYDRDAYDQDKIQQEIKDYNDQLYKTITIGSKTYNVICDDAVDNIDGFVRSVVNNITSHINYYDIILPEGVTAVEGNLTYVQDNDDGTTVYSAPYGLSMTLQASKGTSWYMSYSSATISRDEKYQANGTAYILNVLGDTLIRIEKPTSDNYKVTTIRNYDVEDAVNSIESIKYVQSGETVTLTQPENVANYTFNGFTVDGESKQVGDVITITKDTQININYSSDVSFTVKINDGDAVAYSYNAKVTAVSNNVDGSTAWLEKANGSDSYRLFGYGDSITFFVSENTELKAVSVSDLASYGIDSTSAYANARLSGAMETGTKLTFTGQFVLPNVDGAKKVECGILVGKNITDDSDLVMENVGRSGYSILRGKSTTQTSANQFAISVNNLTGTGKYRAYITYELNGVRTTVYSQTVDWSR